MALRKVFKKDKDKRPIFVTSYDPRLPDIQNIQAKHWRSMIGQDPYLKEVFKAPPLTAFNPIRHRGGALCAPPTGEFIFHLDPYGVGLSLIHI